MSLKALGYGLAAFFAAYAFMAFVGSVLVDFGADAVGIVINVLGYLVPVVAGFVAEQGAALAHRARNGRRVHRCRAGDARADAPRPLVQAERNTRDPPLVCRLRGAGCCLRRSRCKEARRLMQGAGQ